MDINISANTLFHFTASRQNLLGILSNGLYSRYSLENFESLIDDKAEIVFPMICFCDIPLSQVKRHTVSYGKYAIGLSKKWGMDNKVNPVIYTYPKSTTADILNGLMAELSNFFDIDEKHLPKTEDLQKNRTLKEFLSEFGQYLNQPTVKYRMDIAEKIEELNGHLSYFIKYIKPYQGKVFRHNEYLPTQVKFYEEREWRFIPDKETIRKANLKDSFEAEYYKNPIKRRAINIKLAQFSKLTFTPMDIRFIIVEKDSEIAELLDELEKIFGSRATHKDLKLLGTRLISIEQIIEDL